MSWTYYSLLQFHSCIEIGIKQCRNGGIDCKIHALSIIGKKRTAEGQLPTALSFLASDNDDIQVSFVTYYIAAVFPLPASNTVQHSTFYCLGLSYHRVKNKVICLKSCLLLIVYQNHLLLLFLMCFCFSVHFVIIWFYVTMYVLIL